MKNNINVDQINIGVVIALAIMDFSESMENAQEFHLQENALLILNLMELLVYVIQDFILWFLDHVADVPLIKFGMVKNVL